MTGIDVRVLGHRLGRGVPVLVVLLAFSAMMGAAGIPVRSTGWFLTVQALAFALPGTLMWRALRGRAELLIIDATFGTLAMHALLVPVYLALRALGVPQLVGLLPVVVLVGVAVRHRSQPLPRAGAAPTWFSWNVAGAMALALFLLRDAPGQVVGTGARWPKTDGPFAVALTGELKHHLPPLVPFVTGQSLDYHWFAFADLAGVSWLGGQEPDVLTLALVPGLMLMLSMLGVIGLGRLFGGSPVVGVVALWLSVLVGSISLAGWFNPQVIDSTLLFVAWFGSPTQAFAQALLLAVLVLVLDVVRRPDERVWPRLAALVVLTVVLSGAKATFLPVLGAGVLAAVLVSRGRARTLLFAFGVLLAAELAFAQVVLFRGATQGLSASLTGSLHQIATYIGLGPVGSGGLLVLAGFLLVGWLAPLLAGITVLRERDPFAWLLTAMVVASIGAVLALAQPGFSQFFFLRAGLFLGYLLVAVALVRAWSTPARRWLLVLAPAGFVGTVLIRGLAARTAVPVASSRLGVVLAVTVAALLVAGIVGFVVKGGARTSTALLLAGAVALGMGAIRTVDQARGPWIPEARAVEKGAATIPTGGIAAARYLRAHSGPDDLVATNTHCRLPDTELCDNRGHWVSAWTERRTLVQGWGYTARANRAGGSVFDVVYANPFWDPALLKTNDAVFTAPGDATLAALRRRAPVRWLLVDTRYPVDLVGLRKLLPENRRFGETWVFQVPVS